ncbi:lytic transglycosylase domain-containing protein [Methylobacterium sp. J-088]|uniref:lytic transglycosylase domain-containing protein n=1 Tax=Methylobacterium sp. J-088 TaxID=2836664 RepID=UPI001FB8A9DD|nr:lytic transglycosylase domain-containing protein [Methylobacterium sp. J-088]MCJ2065241.1 lytic transglycosylase domain-containing protein [Methylobacterium sp. J-088]
MFLFTTPSSPPESPPPPARAMPGTAVSGPVVQAIRDGAMASGVGFDYLLATARRESALDPAAKAGTSSATGLFQFIEQTWLGVMKNAGPRLGLQAEADAITRQADGSYAVPDAGQRQAILDLRRDPKVSATLAGALTQQNADTLSGALGREPTAGDLYVAHVLGAKGAAALIATARTFPARAAALDLPEAASANRALFYDRTGRARSAAELYASLAATAQGAAAQGTAATDLTSLRQGEAAAPQAVSAYASAATAFGGTSDLRSLFQTDPRVAASDAAARNLQARSQAQPTAHAAPTYFPRTGSDPFTGAPKPDPDVTGALAAPAAPPPGSALANPPLPPRRPAELAAEGSSATVRNSLFAPRRGP